MSTQTLTIENSKVIKQVEVITFKFGKARDNGQADKLINNVRLTDLEYDRSIVNRWIKIACGNIRSAFSKYAENMDDAGDDTQIQINFRLSSKWDGEDWIGFENDCFDYVVNMVVSEFLGLSLPKEADLYRQKAMVALKNAERKLYYKTA